MRKTVNLTSPILQTLKAGFKNQILSIFATCVAITAVTTTSKAQCPGAALTFNSGTPSSVTTTTSTMGISNTFTMEFWVKPSKIIATGRVQNNGLYDYTGITEQNYAVFPFHGGAYPTHAGAGVSVGTNGIIVFEHDDNYIPPILVYYTSISSTNWTHIAIVYINKKPHLYINGTFIKSGLTSNITNVHPSAILSSQSYGPFSGSIDEFKIWSDSMSASTVSAWYNKLSTAGHPKSSSLFLDWKLNDGSGTTASDASGNGYNGTLNNSPTWISPGIGLTDNVKPTITCVSNQTRNYNNTGGTYLVSGTEFNPTFSDNCSGASISNNYNNSATLAGAVFNAGVTNVKWYVTDASGNKDSCTFSITVNTNCALTPTLSNVYTGNKTISTQAELDAFYNTANNQKYTKIIGSLTLDGGSTSDPITNLCNLSALTEITGNLTITNFNHNDNPTDLYNLGELVTLGCNLNVNNNPKLIVINFLKLKNIGCSVYFKDNINALSIILDKLETIKGDQLVIKNNSNVGKIYFSRSAASFSFIGKGSRIEIADNGTNNANALVIDMKKVTSVGILIFHNNDNSTVTNFDNIFTGLTAVNGPLTVTNNNYLNKCCIVASATVTGLRTISGNTGNCSNISAVTADCGSLHKRSTSQTKSEIESVNVYPNPSTGLFTINLYNSQNTPVNITLTDLMGRVLYTKEINFTGAYNHSIDGQFGSGQYLLKVEINNQIQVKHLTVL